jgi:TPR repeat protein
MRRLALFFTIFAALAGEALAVPLPEAEQAYARGDYATAFKLWFPLAEAGSARAQENIARMYERGEWVAQDQTMADEWYRRAAEQRAQDAAMPVPVAVQQAQPVQAQQSNAPTRVSYTPPASPPPVTPASSPASYPVFAPSRPAPLHHHHHGGHRH